MASAPLLVIVSLLLSSVQSELICYTCISQGGGDTTCIDNPAAVANPSAKCKYSYCTIRRIEYVTEPGVISSFYRGCEEEPLSDGRHEDAEQVIWARSCQSSFCNVGDGIDEIGSGGSGGGGNVIIRPDNSAAALNRFPLITYFLLFLLLALRMRGVA